MSGQVSRPAFNKIVSAKLDSSTLNVPVAFSFDPTKGSLMLSDLAGKGYSHLSIINGSATVIGWTNVATNDANPSASTPNRGFVPANGSRVYDDLSIFKYLLIQSEGSAISSGTIYVEVW